MPHRSATASGAYFGHVAVGHLVEYGAVGHALVPVGGGQIRLYPLAVPWRKLARVAVDDQWLAVCVAQEQAELFGFRVFVDQHGCVGKACQIIQINFTRLHQAMHHRKNEQAVGAGRNADPIVGHSVIAGADRVHADHACAAFLDLADAHFDRVAVVVFGDAEQHEQLGMIPIRLAEFPECAAHRIDASGCHVDRTKAAVGRVVWRAEPLRPE